MLALPNEGDDGFDIGSVEMSEEQRKILDEVLADINALQINQETPEDVPKEFCPEIFIYDIRIIIHQTYTIHVKCKIDLPSRPNSQEPAPKTKGNDNTFDDSGCSCIFICKGKSSKL